MLMYFAIASLLVVQTVAAAMPQSQPDTPPRTYRGLVVDEKGVPVAGAAVGFYPGGALDDTAALLEDPTTRTDEAGVYELELSGTGYGGQLAVGLVGRQTCAFALWDPLPTAVLLPGGTLFGRLRNPDGTPVAGAQVAVTSPVLRGTTPLHLRSVGRSDAQGIFSVPGVATTGMKVLVTGEGYYQREVFATQQTPLDLTLERYRGMVRGIAQTPDGKPLADANVTIVGGAGVSAVSAATTDAQGRFAIGVPRAPAFRVRAIQGPLWAVSPLLTGGEDGLVLRAATPPAAASEARTVRVRAADAVDGAPIPRFRATAHARRSNWSEQLAMLAHLSTRAWVEGPEAPVDVQRFSSDCDRIWLVVDAPGYSWDARWIPIDHEGVVEIELGPEAAIAGVVVDSDSGEPIAGAAVRALPVGRSSGSGQNPADAGIRTDPRGQFVILGQKPGDYDVQAHAEDREASAPVRVTAKVDGRDPCRVELDPPHYLRVRVSATEAPPGPPASLDLTLDPRSRRTAEGQFSYFGGNTLLQRLPIAASREYEFGPLQAGRYWPRLVYPSRVQLGHGLGFELQPIETDSEGAVLTLPRIVGHIVRGRVVLPREVSPGRLIVVARSTGANRGGGFLRTPQPSLAPMAGDGSFALDLPPGRYVLQVVDLASGIAFYTGAEPFDVDADLAPMEVHPEIHWLTIRLAVRDAPDAEPIVQSIAISLPTQRGQPSLLDPAMHSAEHNTATVERSVRRPGLQWLVPRGPISLRPQQSWGHLGEAAPPPSVAETTTVEIRGPHEEVTLTVAAPPSIEEQHR